MRAEEGGVELWCGDLGTGHGGGIEEAAGRALGGGGSCGGGVLAGGEWCGLNAVVLVEDSVEEGVGLLAGC